MPKIELGKKYRTRNGRDVEILTTTCRDSEYPVFGLLDIGNRQRPEKWTATGKLYANNKSDDPSDLIEVAPLVEWWSAVHVGNCSTSSFRNRPEAVRRAQDMEVPRIVHWIHDPNTGDLKVEVEKV